MKPPKRNTRGRPKTPKQKIGCPAQKPKKNKKLFAVLHDGDTKGDSAFYAICIPYTPGDSKEKLLNAMVREELGPIAEEDIPGAIEDAYGDPTGAWIVDANTKKAAEAIYKSGGGGGDGVVYATNRAAKTLCKTLAITSITF